MNLTRDRKVDRARNSSDRAITEAQERKLAREMAREEADKGKGKGEQDDVPVKSTDVFSDVSEKKDSKYSMSEKMKKKKEKSGGAK